MSGSKPLVISASIAIDRLMRFAGRYSELIQPDKLDSLAISTFVTDTVVANGGVAANIAYSLALLGEHPVLSGAVGPDAAGYIKQLSVLGIDTSHVYRSQLPTASFTVLTDAVQSQIGGFYPGAMFDSDSLTLEPWKDASPLIVVGPHDPKAMRRQVEQCRNWQLELCYDIGQQVSNLEAADIAAGVDTARILICNDFELSALSKKIGRAVDDIKRQVPIVITTLGANGSRIEGADVPAPLVIGAAKPNQVVDTTGAGDAYRSGFLYGYIRDWPLKACGQLGAVTSSFAVEYATPQEHHFTWDGAIERYKNNFNESLPRD